MEIEKGREGVRNCGGGSEPEQPRRDSILLAIARGFFRITFYSFREYKQLQPPVAHILGHVISNTAGCFAVASPIIAVLT
jgi:hypothetical protein